MVNYNNFEELFSGISNASAIISNSTSYDDSSYILNISSYINTTSYFPNKFYYNNTLVQYLTCNGNGWIGFSNSSSGSENNSLKINRRDMRMTYLYQELCTVQGMYVLRIRWQGTSAYSTSYMNNTSYKISFDVALLSNGIIVVYLNYIPSYNNYTGTASYNGLWMNGNQQTYCTFSSSSRIATFTPTDAALGNKFTYTTTYPNLVQRSYLVQDSNGNIYGNDPLENLGILNIDYRLFNRYGIKRLPTLEELLNINNPSLLAWQSNKLPSINVSYDVNEVPENEIHNGESINYTLSKSIELVKVHGYRNVKFILSFDSGTTWVTYDKENEIWTQPSDSFDSWIDIDTMESISIEKWAEINLNNTFKFKYVILDEDSYFKEIIIY